LVKHHLNCQMLSSSALPKASCNNLGTYLPLLLACLHISDAWVHPRRHPSIKISTVPLNAIRIPFLERKERSREQVGNIRCPDQESTKFFLCFSFSKAIGRHRRVLRSKLGALGRCVGRAYAPWLLPHSHASTKDSFRPPRCAK